MQKGEPALLAVFSSGSSLQKKKETESKEPTELLIDQRVGEQVRAFGADKEPEALGTFMPPLAGENPAGLQCWGKD